MTTIHAAQAGQGGPVTIACVNKATVDLGVPFDNSLPLCRSVTTSTFCRSGAIR